MYKNMLYALNDNPFMAAIFKQDRQVFGTYLRKPGNFFRTTSEEQADTGSAPRFIFVTLMQEAGRRQYTVLRKQKQESVDD